jgi:hypothetical protein
MALAYPTLIGPTGQAVIPTAEIAPAFLTVAGDYRNLPAGTSFPVRALVTPLSSLEVGALYDPYDDEALLEEAWSANAKIQALEIFGGETAVGAIFRRETDRADFDTDYWQGYFAWTSDFDREFDTTNIVLTWGVNWTQLEFANGVSEEAVRGFAGLRLLFANGVTLAGEYQTKASDLGDADPLTSAVIRVHLGENFALEVGTTNAIGLVTESTHRLFAGAEFTFGGGGEWPTQRRW